MAESNTTRLALRQWSAGTDTPQRSEFNSSFLSLENLAAIDKQDAFASRPAAGVRGTYFWDTTNDTLWRDNGSSWHSVGAKPFDVVAKSSAAGNVAVTVNAITGQTANLLDLRVNNTLMASVTKDGNISGGTYAGKSASFVNTVNATAVIAGKGSSGQTANLLELKNTSDTNMFTVSAAGALTATHLKTGSSSTINTSTATTVANMSYWSGVPSLEVRANGSGTFNDFIYLKHAAADPSDANRRLGILMKVGDEDAGGAARSGALYMFSGEDTFDNASLRIDVRDLNVWDFKPTSVGSVTPYPVTSSAAYMAAVPTGTGAFKASNTWIGTQNSGNTMYARSGSTANGFYWYAGGTHDDDLGDNGGGKTLGILAAGTTMGDLTVGKLNLTDVVDAAPGTSSPTFQLGDSTSNIIMDNNEIMHRQNGDAGELLIQHEGGEVLLGNDDTIVSLNDIPFYVSVNGIGPTGPQTGWLWLDGRVGQGIKRYNGTTWQLL